MRLLQPNVRRDVASSNLRGPWRARYAMAAIPRMRWLALGPLPPFTRDDGVSPVGQLAGTYLMSPHFSVADAYLYLMLRWAVGFGLPLSDCLQDYFERISDMPPCVRHWLKSNCRNRCWLCVVWPTGKVILAAQLSSPLARRCRQPPSPGSTANAQNFFCTPIWNTRPSVKNFDGS